MKKLLGLCVLLGSMNAFGARYEAGDCVNLTNTENVTVATVNFMEVVEPDYVMDFTYEDSTNKVTRDIAVIDKLFLKGEELGIITSCEE